MLRLIKILEGLWLTLAVATLGIGIYQTFKNGIENSWIHFVFCGIALLLFWARRTQRRRLERTPKMPPKETNDEEA